MKIQENKKKVWTKPAVQALNIKKNTFTGTETGPEGAGKDGPPVKS